MEDERLEKLEEDKKRLEREREQQQKAAESRNEEGDQEETRPYNEWGADERMGCSTNTNQVLRQYEWDAPPIQIKCSANTNGMPRQYKSNAPPIRMVCSANTNRPKAGWGFRRRRGGGYANQFWVCI